MNRVPIIVLFAIIANFTFSQKLSVSENGRYLVTETGTPFFWMGDTAWELFHRCNREEASAYLTKRASQGFNVVQAVVLAELDGLNTPNAYGETPLRNNDPTQPNGAYFEHVDYIVQKAGALGLHMALLPSWGDKLYKAGWGVGPEIFTPETAKIFGTWIGQRYKDFDNVIWIIGGDRNPREGSDDIAVWNAMAEAIAAAAGGYEKTLMSFHPQPKDGGGSSTWFHDQPWLDFNMHQTGHCANQGTYSHITHDYGLSPVKPVLDGEPLYEDHPNCFNAKELGHSIPEDIRRIMYWNVFAGAFGQTYGCHDVWQMYTPEREGINQPLRPWRSALELPMAHAVKHLKNLMLSRPFLSRIPDMSMVGDRQENDNNFVIATRDALGSYAMIYFPTGKMMTIDFSGLRATSLISWWYDPRTGISFKGPPVMPKAISVIPPSSGPGHDWVLVVDDASRAFAAPGKIQ
ncbi:MAG TPA: glycoside hydrolase family 140 protein [Eudoraea sp.]|nr:glycoside hydrolase family 140 protein [Eudoraea sp.]